MESTCSDERPCINCFAGHGDTCLGPYKKPSWDECVHKWKAKVDSQFSNEYNEDVDCTVCGCPGDRDIKTGEVFWPAT
jgi:hypothetical protein